MEGSSPLTTTSSSFPSFRIRPLHFSPSFSSSLSFSLSLPHSSSSSSSHSLSLSCPRTSLRTSTFSVETPNTHNSNSNSNSTSTSTSNSDALPKTDKSGRFCSPRAARELALSIVYASCLEGSDPVRLFEKRINARREPGYEFDKESLLKYNHMSFGGPPVTVETVEEEEELMRNDDKESAIEVEVLAAPPKLVYSKLLLRLTRKLLVAVSDHWDRHVLFIDKVAPPNWKNEPAGRILEFCILHLAMSEISVLGTRHQIVINEAVDLAKRFCDGAAPRVINGCLGTFVKDIEETGLPLALEDKQKVVSSVDRQ